MDILTQWSITQQKKKKREREREWTTYALNNMNEYQKYDAEWKKPCTKKYIQERSHLK